LPVGVRLLRGAQQTPEGARLFSHRHLLGIEGLSRSDIEAILDLAEVYVALNRGPTSIPTRCAG
jgi:hypothetical protein